MHALGFLSIEPSGQTLTQLAALRSRGGAKRPIRGGSRTHAASAPARTPAHESPVGFDGGHQGSRIGAHDAGNRPTPLRWALFSSRHRPQFDSIFFRLSRPPRYTPLTSLSAPASLSASGGLSEVFLRLKVPLHTTLVIPSPLPGRTMILDL